MNNQTAIIISQETANNIYRYGTIFIMVLSIIFLMKTMFDIMNKPYKYGKSVRVSAFFPQIFGVMIFMALSPKVLKMILDALVQGQMTTNTTGSGGFGSNSTWNVIGWVVIAVSIAGILIYTLVNTVPDIKQSRKDRIEDKEKRTQIQKEIAERKINIFDRFNTIKNDYTHAEVSPETLLHAPLILDVHYPFTAAFHRNLRTAQNNIDVLQHQKDENIMSFLIETERSLDKLEKSWIDLKNNAYRIGIPVIDAKVADKAQKMLSQVLDESITPEEREVYAQKLVELLRTSQKKLSRAKQEEVGRIIDIISEKIFGAVEQGQLTSSNTTMLMLER